ncbi:CLUMA_CG008310, isoform A [Clunio marinus]|uniref:CLUMA_CG008310, isoform A n=1 Tax=Clunio marinus TaxID=568069 RepID=A0A1J1I3D0_9DIPT|nr:CLUMA_CG008310, isoform A [Clunio marinus]
MPAEVRMFIEEDSIERLTNNIEKIRSFQENQALLFDEKTKLCTEEFKKFKDTLERKYNKKKEINEAMEVEFNSMNCLKDAYRSNKITSDIFKLGSRLNMDFSPKRGSSDVGSRASSSHTQRSFSLTNLSLNQNESRPFIISPQSSRKLSPIMETSGTEMTPSRAFSHTRQISQLQSSSHSSISNQSTPSSRSSSRYRNDLRKDLLESTLRHMNKISQENYRERCRQEYSRK